MGQFEQRDIFLQTRSIGNSLAAEFIKKIHLLTLTLVKLPFRRPFPGTLAVERESPRRFLRAVSDFDRCINFVGLGKEPH